MVQGNILYLSFKNFLFDNVLINYSFKSYFKNSDNFLFKLVNILLCVKTVIKLL